MERHRSAGAGFARPQTGRSTIRRTGHALVAIVLLAIGLLLAGGLAEPAGAASDPQFELSGNFTGLYPDADLVVPVTVHNPQRYAVMVTTATIVIGDATAQCGAANLSADRFSGGIMLDAKASTTIPIRMHMAANAPDACQGVTFPLSFNASGDIVGPSATSSGFAYTGFRPGSQFLGALGSMAFVLGLLIVATRRRTQIDFA